MTLDLVTPKAEVKKMILFNKPATKLGLLINQIKLKLNKSNNPINNIVCSELITPKAASKQETNRLLPLSQILN